MSKRTVPGKSSPTTTTTLPSSSSPSSLLSSHPSEKVVGTPLHHERMRDLQTTAQRIIEQCQDYLDSYSKPFSPSYSSVSSSVPTLSGLPMKGHTPSSPKDTTTKEEEKKIEISRSITHDMYTMVHILQSLSSSITNQPSSLISLSDEHHSLLQRILILTISFLSSIIRCCSNTTPTTMTTSTTPRTLTHPSTNFLLLHEWVYELIYNGIYTFIQAWLQCVPSSSSSSLLLSIDDKLGICERIVFIYGTGIIVCRSRGALTTAVSLHQQGERLLQSCLSVLFTSSSSSSVTVSSPSNPLPSSPFSLTFTNEQKFRYNWIIQHKDLLLSLEYVLANAKRSKQERRSRIVPWSGRTVPFASLVDPSTTRSNESVFLNNHNWDNDNGKNDNLSLPDASLRIPYNSAVPFLLVPLIRTEIATATAWKGFVSYIESKIVQRLTSYVSSSSSTLSASSLSRSLSASASSAGYLVENSHIAPLVPDGSLNMTKETLLAPAIRRRRAVMLLNLYREADEGIHRSSTTPSLSTSSSSSPSLSPIQSWKAVRYPPRDTQTDKYIWSIPSSLSGILREGHLDVIPEEQLYFLRDRCRLLLRMSAAAEALGKASSSHYYLPLWTCRPDIYLITSVLRECASLLTSSLYINGKKPIDIVKERLQTSKAVEASTNPTKNDCLNASLPNRRGAEKAAKALVHALASRRPADALVTRFIAGLMVHMRTPPATSDNRDDQTPPKQYRTDSVPRAGFVDWKIGDICTFFGIPWDDDDNGRSSRSSSTKNNKNNTRSNNSPNELSTLFFEPTFSPSYYNSALSVPQQALMHYCLVRIADTASVLEILAYTRDVRWSNHNLLNHHRPPPVVPLGIRTENSPVWEQGNSTVSPSTTPLSTFNHRITHPAELSAEWVSNVLLLLQDTEQSLLLPSVLVRTIRIAFLQYLQHHTASLVSLPSSTS